MRAVLFGLLAASCGLGASACTSHDGAPHVASGTPVGTVLAVEGVATATRDGTQRALAVGDSVSPDDTIAAGAEGSVVVQLVHNHALLELNRGATSRVDASAAWHLTADQVAADSRRHASVAAGRNGERTAADGRDTASGPASATAVAPARAMIEAPQEPAAPPTAPSAVPTEPVSGAPRRGRADASDRPIDRPVAAAPRQPESAPPPPPPPPRRVEVQKEKAARDESNDAPAGAPIGSPGGGVAVSGLLDGSEVGRGGARASTSTREQQVVTALHAHDAALRACLPAKTTVKLVVVVAAASVQVRFADATTTAGATVLACLTREIRTLKLAGAAATVQLDVSR